MKWEKIFTVITLAAILILGFYLRVNHVDDKSLWLDEGITYYNSSGNSLEDVWIKVAHLDQSPPGFYFLMHYFLEYFGNNEFGLRVVQVIFGILTILFTYLLGKELFGKTAGMVGAFLLAINSFHIGFSIEARMYSLLAFESIAGMYFLIRAMRAEKIYKFMHWMAFTLFAIAGLYTHNFFVFICASFLFAFLLLLITEKKRLINLGLAFLSGLLVVSAYVPWLPAAIKQFQVSRYWIAPNHISDLWTYLYEFMNRDNYLLWGFIGLSAFGIAGTFVYFWNKNYKRNLVGLLIAVGFLAAGIGLPLYYSLNVEPILKIRYMVYLVPMLMILASSGIWLLGKTNKIFAIVISVVFCSFTFYWSQPWQASAYPVEMNEDFRELYAMMSVNPAPIVVHTPSIAHVMDFYNREGLTIIPFPNSFDLSDYNIDLTYKRSFLTTIENLESFYLIVSHSHENPYGLLKTWSDGQCLQQEELPSSSPLIEAFYFSGCLNK